MTHDTFLECDTTLISIEGGKMMLAVKSKASGIMAYIALDPAEAEALGQSICAWARRASDSGEKGDAA